MEHADHPVVAVRYVKDIVTAVCGCGWESSEHPDETKARAEHEKHVAKKVK